MKSKETDIIYVYMVSLGCNKNFVDTEVMAASLLTHEIGLTENMDEANVFVINTCAFIPPARKEAESNIDDALSWKTAYPEGKIIVTGCLTQWDKKGSYTEKYPEVDLWLGIDELTLLPEKIAGLHSDDKMITGHTQEVPLHKIICHDKPKYLYDDKTPRLQLTPSHYANVKIAEGCDNRCAYCAIPLIRGDLRSRNIKSVLKEAKSLLKNEVKELLIIAQDITAFGRDRKHADDLSALLVELDKIEGNHWIRLHYLHPEGITDKLISVLAESKHIIPYLDIPLQHISDNVLENMNRRITSSEIKEILSKLREAIPNLVIRTTFLVGFPGELDAEFNELKEFVSEWKFERLGVFTFYPEQGTKAVALPNQIPFDIAEKRAKIIYKIHKKNSSAFNKKLEGQVFDVIIDSAAPEYAIGRTYMDSPEIDNTVKIDLPKKLKQGKMAKIKITGSSAFELTGIEG